MTGKVAVLNHELLAGNQEKLKEQRGASTSKDKQTTEHQHQVNGPLTTVKDVKDMWIKKEQGSIYQGWLLLEMSKNPA